MATLKKLHKVFIIQEFAMFAAPWEIVPSIKEQFGVDVTLQQLNYWNPNVNNSLAKEWLEIFQTTRTKFLDETSSIAIANKAFRLKELDAMYRTQKRNKTPNPKAMREILEQAAKESGDSYTNRKEITGANGGAIQLHSKSLDDWKKDATARTTEATSVLEMFENEN